MRLAKTGKLSPTKRGFKVVERELRAVSAIASERKGARAKALTYQLSIRYRDARGRFKSLDTQVSGFPLPKTITKRKRKGESRADTFVRLAGGRIRSAVFRSIDGAEGVAKYTPAVERALASGDREKIARAMKAFKERRGVSFTISVNREVTGGSDVRAKRTTKTVPRRVRQRGRRKR